MGDRGRARGASAADPASLGRSPPVTIHRRDTPAGAEPAVRLDSSLDHVGCHASRSMRRRMCRKSGAVKELSASCSTKYQGDLGDTGPPDPDDVVSDPMGRRPRGNVPGVRGPAPSANSPSMLPERPQDLLECAPPISRGWPALQGMASSGSRTKDGQSVVLAPPNSLKS
jgi:hypothetical protein